MDDLDIPLRIDCTELDKVLKRLERLLEEHPKTMRILIDSGDGDSFLKLLTDSINVNKE
jgi:hypothetical protein